jgi:hypothetical protein
MRVVAGLKKIQIGGKSRRNGMTSKNNNERNVALAVADPYSGSSLLPMLVSGLVLIVVGMIAVAVLS